MKLSDLLTAAQVGELAGIQTATVHQHHWRHTMPEPALVIAGRPLWLRETVEQWIATRRAPGGAPRQPEPTAPAPRQPAEPTRARQPKRHRVGCHCAVCSG